MTHEPPPHPALAVLDERIKVSKGLFDVAYSAAQAAEAYSKWMGERVDLLVKLRDEITRAMADKPALVVKRERRPRRTKAEIAAAREKTLAATAEAGLVTKPLGSYPPAPIVSPPTGFPDAVAVPPEMRRG